MSEKITLPTLTYQKLKDCMLSDQIPTLSSLSTNLSSIESYFNNISNDISNKIWIKDIKSDVDKFVNGITSDLSIIKISKDDYDKNIGLNTTPLCSNILYIVDSDYIDAYGQQLCNLAMPNFEKIDVAVNKAYVEDEISSLSDTVSSNIGLLSDALSDEISNQIKELGITKDSPTFTQVDYSSVITTTTEPSWTYMCKFDANVFLESITDSNYGELFAYPVKGMTILNTDDFSQLKEEKEVAIATYSGEYSYIDKNDVDAGYKLSTVEDAQILNNVYDDQEVPYRWCSIYSCPRNLDDSDKLADQDIKFVAQSDKESKVINPLISAITTMDFSFKENPFVISKGLDYIFVLRWKYVDDLSNYNLFDDESLKTITYFRCQQYLLNSELTNTTHGCIWLGFRGAEDWRNDIKTWTIGALKTSQTTEAELASHSYKYIGPMNFVKNTSKYTLLNSPVIQSSVLDAALCNVETKNAAEEEHKYIHNYIEELYEMTYASFEDVYAKMTSVKDLSGNVLSSLSVSMDDNLNAQFKTIENVADPIEDTDAANKQYVDMKVSDIKSMFGGLSVTNTTTIQEAISMLSALISRANNL